MAQERVDVYVNACNNNPNPDGMTRETAFPTFAGWNINVNYSRYEEVYVYVAPGIYNTSSYSNQAFGTATLWVNRSNVKVMKDPYPYYICPEEEIIFDGNNGSTDVGIVAYSGQLISNFHISDMKVQNFKKNGIIIQRFDNSSIVNCKVHDIIGVDNDDDNCASIQIKNSMRNLIENCTIVGTNSQNKPAQLDGIYLQFSTDITIKKNNINLFNNYNGALGDPHIDQIQLYSSIGPINIENNSIKFLGTFAGFGTGGGQQGIYFTETTGEITIRNNIVVSGVGKSIGVYLEEGTTGINVYNNTLIGENINGVLTGPLVEFTKNLGSVDVLKMKNNILYKEGSSGTDPSAVKFTSILEDDLAFRGYINNNLYYNTNIGFIPTYYFDPDPEIEDDEYSRPWNWSAPPDYERWWEVNGRNGDPLFENVAGEDFRINYLSPAKNIGIAYADLTTDYNDKTRPYWGNDYDAGAYEVEDTQLKFTSNVDQQTTHSLTSVGTYWERNSSGVNGAFNISTDQGLGSATCETPATAPNDDEIWKFPGVEYKWMDWSNNNSEHRIAAGFYKVSNNRNNAYFYLDLRDAVETYNLNVYLKLIGGQSPKYQYRQNGTFDNHDIANGSVKRIWEINSGQPYTIGLSEYWAYCLVPLSMNNHPFIVWGPYPSSDAMERHHYEISRKLSINNWGVFDSVNSSTYQYEDATYNLGTSFPAYYKVRKVEGEDPTRIYSAYTNTVTITVQGINPGKYNTGIEIFDFILEQNYPNPFNPLTTVSFSIPEEELVIMKLYDILGKEVKVLVNSRMNAGRYNVTVDLSSLSSGVYLYSINAGKYSSIKKMQLLK